LAAAVCFLAAGPVPPARGLGQVGRPVEDVIAGPTVLVFTRTDCPISNRYAPELRRLRRTLAGRGLRFWLVYPDPAESPDAIRRHTREFAFGFEAVRDPHHDLVRLAGATVTPEAAVFVSGPSGPQMVYRGRIDDRAAALGRTRPAPGRRDLEDVLEALAEGRTVVPRTTTAVGCVISALR
jgi:hypothetical protein